MPKASRKKQTRAARQATSEAPVADGRTQAAHGAPHERAAASLPILKKLSAEEETDTSASDKRWACAGLANLLADCDASTRRMLQSHKVVDLLLKSSQHGDILVQAEAVGALRNLAVSGGAEICAEMVNKGIISAISSHLDRITQRIQGTVEYAEDSHTHGVLWDWAENLSILIWCLAEGSPKCLPALNGQHGLAPFFLLLVKCYATHDFNPPPPVSVALSALHALTVLTSNNLNFIVPMLSLDLDPLLSLLPTQPHKHPSKSPRIESQRYLSRVLALCALLNIVATKSQVHKKRDKMLLSELKSQVDPQSLPLLLEGLLAFKDHKLASATEDDLEDVQVLLECLGEVCSALDGFDEEEEWAGITAEQQSEDAAAMDEDMPQGDDTAQEEEASMLNEEPEEEDEDLLAEMDAVTQPNESGLTDTTLKLVQQTDLPSALITIALHEPSNAQSNVLPTSAASASLDGLALSWQLVRQRALEALNNFLFTLARQHATNVIAPSLMQSLWQALLQLSMALAAAPKDALKSSVGCLWALASMSFGTDAKGKLSDTPLFEVQEEHITVLLQLLQGGVVGQDDLIAEIQSRVAGALAVLGARDHVPIEQNDAIGTALITPFTTLDVNNPPSSAMLSLLAQVLDSFIDLYSDETKPTEKVFQSKNFLDVLRPTLPKLQGLAKKVDKRKLPELRFRMDAGVKNLRAFIKYRERLQ